MMNLIINKEAYNDMQQHAESTFPKECCGFFFGLEQENEKKNRLITLAKPVNNSKTGDQRRRFEISAYDYLTAEQYAEANELMLLGIYHSHPNHPAKPSIHDLKQAVPFFSYIIISVMEGAAKDITSWQLDGNNQFQQESIETTEPNQKKINNYQ